MTRRITAVAFSLSLLCFTALADDNPFALQLPQGFGAFAKSSQSAPSKEGPIQTTNWISKDTNGGAVIVSMSQMPAKILDPNKLLESTKDALLKSTKTTLDTEEQVTGADPAVRLMLHNDLAWIRARLMVSGDKLYQVIYVGRSADQRSATPIAQMFQSFHPL